MLRDLQGMLPIWLEHRRRQILRYFCMLLMQNPKVQLTLAYTLKTLMSQHLTFCTALSLIRVFGRSRKVIAIQPIFRALGPVLVKNHESISCYHRLRYNRQVCWNGGGATCWCASCELHDQQLEDFVTLGTTLNASSKTICVLESFVCKLYLPCTNMSIPQLRWWFFKKWQAQSESLPPNQSTLKAAILRAHFQTMTWMQASTRTSYLLNNMAIKQKATCRQQ